MSRPLFLRLLCILLLALAGAACSVRTWEDSAGGMRQPPAPKPVSEDEEAARIWQRFATRAVTAETMTGPFRIAANLRYTDASKKSTRVSALLWGNGNMESPYPLRLDLMAGIGSVVAKVREDDNRFTAYVPEENTAYDQAGDDRSLTSLGVPIPLTLGDLTLLLSGRCGLLFLPSGAQAMALPPYHNFSKESVSYTLAGTRLPGILELSPTGAPLSWREAREQGWSIAFEASELHPLQPEKLRVAHSQGYSALIVVKDISRVSPPYTSAQMDLELPPGAPTKPFPERR